MGFGGGRWKAGVGDNFSDPGWVCLKIPGPRRRGAGASPWTVHWVVAIAMLQVSVSPAKGGRIASQNLDSASFNIIVLVALKKISFSGMFSPSLTEHLRKNKASRPAFICQLYHLRFFVFKNCTPTSSQCKKLKQQTVYIRLNHMKLSVSTNFDLQKWSLKKNFFLIFIYFGCTWS